jgi:hypothetical protein
MSFKCTDRKTTLPIDAACPKLQAMQKCVHCALEGKREHCQDMGFKYPMGELPLHHVGCFWSTIETGMLRFKIGGEYRNYILSILKMFFRNFNTVHTL